MTTSPKKDCLKEITKNFLMELEKLEKIEHHTTNINFYSSWFVSNADVARIRARKAVVDEIFKPIHSEIFKLTKDKKPDFFPLNYSQEQKIALIQNRINLLTEQQAGVILGNFMKSTEEIVNASVVERSKIIDSTMGMTGMDERKSALKEHSLSDNWVFTFLAKLVKIIREKLGTKTTSETLLEESRDKAAKNLNLPETLSMYKEYLAGMLKKEGLMNEEGKFIASTATAPQHQRLIDNYNRVAALHEQIKDNQLTNEDKTRIRTVIEQCKPNSDAKEQGFIEKITVKLNDDFKLKYQQATKEAVHSVEEKNNNSLSL
ncbi:hypothetical protein [Legionella septentrionalis]|uniref:hypothetical protein n=1 Tax=Legionella septentrionalis TaxID=2498109 RepID=UPI000F8E3A17|nr:hypothetical protein [Legionella septentrionalis]RUR09700.1 hypothetical protein ELY14_07815 [Legionella septentrionalis]